MPLKEYVANPDKWARYFTDLAEGKIQQKTGRNSRIIIIDGDDRPKTARNSILTIEAVTPVQQMNERVISELSRKRKRDMSKGVLEKTRDIQVSDKPCKIKRLAPRLDSSGF